MSTYFFETITAAQALAYQALGNDTLVFTNPTSSGAKMTVLFNPATATAPPTVTLIDNVTGRSVTFGSGILGEGSAGNPIVFPDGSNLLVGLTTDDTNTSGTSGA